MARIPDGQHDKQYDSHLQEFESTRLLGDRKAKLKAETELEKIAQAAEAARVSGDREIAAFRGLPQPGETRDQLLDRIRMMREEDAKPKAAPPEGYRAPDMMSRFAAEQAAGRAAVAQAEIEAERSRIAREAARAEGEKNAVQAGAVLASKPGNG